MFSELGRSAWMRKTNLPFDRFIDSANVLLFVCLLFILIDCQLTWICALVAYLPIVTPEAREEFRAKYIETARIHFYGSTFNCRMTKNTIQRWFNNNLWRNLIREIKIVGDVGDVTWSNICRKS